MFSFPKLQNCTGMSPFVLTENFGSDCVDCFTCELNKSRLDYSLGLSDIRPRTQYVAIILFFPVAGIMDGLEAWFRSLRKKLNR